MEGARARSPRLALDVRLRWVPGQSLLWAGGEGWGVGFWQGAGVLLPGPDVAIVSVP